MTAGALSLCRVLMPAARQPSPDAALARRHRILGPLGPAVHALYISYAPPRLKQSPDRIVTRRAGQRPVGPTILDAVRLDHCTGENGAASMILESCLSVGTGGGGGHTPVSCIRLRTAMRSSRLL